MLGPSRSQLGQCQGSIVGQLGRWQLIGRQRGGLGNWLLLEDGGVIDTSTRRLVYRRIWKWDPSVVGEELCNSACCVLRVESWWVVGEHSAASMRQGYRLAIH